MPESSREAKRRAEAASERKRAMSEYVAEGESQRAKTAKLRALRLAREAEEQAAAEAAPAKSRKKAKKR